MNASKGTLEPARTKAELTDTPISVELLHLNETGYGPGGLMTRLRWREECLALIGRRDIANVPANTNLHGSSELALARFGVRFVFADGTDEIVGDDLLLSSTTIDVADVTFEALLDISNTGCQVPLWAVGAKCKQGITLRRTQFYKEVRLDRFACHERADFANTRFEQSVSFRRAFFRREVSFKDCIFRYEAVFDAVTFSETVTFTGSPFYGDAEFQSARFLGDCQFSGIACAGAFLFTAADFKGIARFDNASLAGLCNFEGTQFESDALFTNSKFKLGASFMRATFVGVADFRAAEFSDQAHFSESSFELTAEFYGTHFIGKAEFDQGTFKASAIFENAKFSNVGDFSEAKFLADAPSFNGVEQKTTLFFRNAVFPEPKGLGAIVDRYVYLKQLSEAQGHHWQSLTFNALELGARRRLPSEPNLAKVMTWLYEWTSLCGRSYLRPLGLLCALLCATYLLALGHASINSPPLCKGARQLRVLDDLWRHVGDCEVRQPYPIQRILRPEWEPEYAPIELSGYRAAAEYTILGFLGVIELPGKDRRVTMVNARLFGNALEPAMVRTWGVLKAIATAALVFLVALGLRNSYRVRS